MTHNVRTAARAAKANGCAIRKGSAWWLRTRERDGQEQTRLAGQTFGYLSLFDSSPANQLAVLLSANGTTGGYLSLNNSNASPRAYLAGHNSGGYLYLYQADGDFQKLFKIHAEFDSTMPRNAAGLRDYAAFVRKHAA